MTVLHLTNQRQSCSVSNLYRDASLSNDCVKTLSLLLAPQLWSTLSGHLRDIVNSCYSYKRMGKTDAAQSIYAATGKFAQSFMADLSKFLQTRDAELVVSEAEGRKQREAMTDLAETMSTQFSLLQNLLARYDWAADVLQAKAHGFTADVDFAASTLAALPQDIGSNLQQQVAIMREALAAVMRTYKINADQAVDKLKTDLEMSGHQARKQMQETALSGQHAVQAMQIDLEMFVDVVQQGEQALVNLVQTSNSLQTALARNVELSHKQLSVQNASLFGAEQLLHAITNATTQALTWSTPYALIKSVPPVYVFGASLLLFRSFNPVTLFVCGFGALWMSAGQITSSLPNFFRPLHLPFLHLPVAFVASITGLSLALFAIAYICNRRWFLRAKNDVEVAVDPWPAPVDHLDIKPVFNEEGRAPRHYSRRASRVPSIQITKPR